MNTLQNIFEPTRLVLVWRCDPKKGTRTRRLVGVVEKHDDEGTLCLRYLSDSDDFKRAKDVGFEGYPAFPLSTQTHCTGVLGAFMRRLPPRKRDDFNDYLARHRLPIGQDISDLALLAYTNAKLPSDGFELYPDMMDARPPFEMVVEVAGFRHQKEIEISNLYVGDPIIFKSEANNAHDKNAVGIYYNGRRMGFVDRAQAPSFREWLRKGYSVKGVIERLNGTVERPAVYIFVMVR